MKKEKSVMEMVLEYVEMSKTITDESAKEKEGELFLIMDYASPGLEKAVAFKKWKDHVIKYATEKISLESYEPKMKQLTLQIELSEKAFELLKSIENGGYLEYRDSEFETLEDFLKSDLYENNIRTEEWFLSRNSNGSLYLITELFKHGFVDNNFDSWHLTYKISELGKKILEQNK